jgi:hypothetical protein
VKEARREGLEIMGVDIERALWFGKKHLTSRNGKPLRYMNGIYNYIPSDNKIAATNGALTMDQLDEWMLKIFRFGSSEKMAFGGNRALATIQAAVRKNTSYQIENKVKEYGMSVTRITSPYGELVFKSHPLFAQYVGGTTGGTAYAALDAAMFVMDMSQLQYVHFTDCDIHYEPDLATKGFDGEKAGWLGELSLELGHASTHFFFKNMNSGAKDA